MDGRMKTKLIEEEEDKDTRNMNSNTGWRNGELMDESESINLQVCWPFSRERAPKETFFCVF